MDKIFSTRVSETVIKHIGILSRRLKISKKAVIEKAINELSRRIETMDENDDLLMESFGAWQRDESPEATVEEAREQFQSSMERHHR